MLTKDFMKVKRCVGCSQFYGKNKVMIKVRIQTSDGYHISHMCDSCLDVCIKYKLDKKVYA